MKEEKLYTEASWRMRLRRIIAALLAISMVLIPVELPKIAWAAGSDTFSTTLSEDFSGGGYAAGEVYKWNETLSDGSTSMIQQGTYNFNISEKADSSLVLLSAQSDGWADYTASMDLYKKYLKDEEDIVSYHPGILLLCRVQYDEEHGGYVYYRAKAHSSSGIVFSKRYYDEEAGKFVDTTIGNARGVPAPDGVWRNLQMTCKDNVFVATITDTSGKSVSYTFIDDGETYGPVYETGGVGMLFESMSTDKRTWKAKIDNFKVVAEDGAQLFADDFSDARYQRGINYSWEVGEVDVSEVMVQWVEEHGVNSTGGISDGAYQWTPRSETKIWLSTEGKNLMTGKYAALASNWLDYTVDFDWQADYSNYEGKETGIPSLYVLGRVAYDEEHGGYSYYQVRLSPIGGAYIYKYYYDTQTNQWVQSKKSTAGANLKTFGGPFTDAFKDNAKVHVSVTFKNVATGVNIEVTLKDENGNVVNSVRPDAAGQGGKTGCTGNRTDDGVTVAGPILKGAGSVGLEAEAGNWSLTIDNFKVTLEGEDEPAFADDFADDSYIRGVSTQINPNNVEVWPLTYTSDIEFTWNDSLALRSGATPMLKDGILTWNVDNTSRSIVLLDSYAKDPIYPDKALNPTDSWDNYTVQMDCQSAYDTDGTAPSILLIGRAQFDSRGNLVAFYGLKAHETNGIIINKYVYDKTTGNWLQGRVGKIGPAEGGTGISGSKMRRFTATFKNTAEGVSITVTLTDRNGVNVLKSPSFTCVDNGSVTVNSGSKIGQSMGAPLTYGTVGYELDNVGDLVWTANIDNFKVTLSGDQQPAFEETFTPTGNQGYVQYMAQPHVLKDALKANEYVFPATWQYKNGIYNVSTLDSRINLIDISTNFKDYDVDMSNYTVDVDLRLENAASMAGIVSHYLDGTYYELRLTTSKLELYKVAGTEETLIRSVDVKVDPNTWYSLQFQVERNGKAAYIYLDHELMIDLRSIPGACKNGTLGLVVNGNASFDNLTMKSTEASDGRPFNVYQFNVNSVEELKTGWTLTNNWTVRNNQLVYTGGGTSVMPLNDAAAHTDYQVDVRGVMTAGGQVGLVGRYSSTGYYQLVLDYNTRELTLSKVVNGVSTVLEKVSGAQLYLEGITVDAGQRYDMSLYMYGDSLQGFLNGIRLIACKDETLSEGSAGVVGTNGVSFKRVVVKEALALPKLTFVDRTGKPLFELKEVPKEEVDPSLWVSGVDFYEVEYEVGTYDSPMHIPLGKMPDITELYLKVEDGINDPKIVAVDQLEFSDMIKDELGMHTLEVEYEGDIAVLYYETIDRTEEIEELIQQIEQFSLDEMRIEDKGDVYDMTERYNDLSYIEKEQIGERLERKLYLMREAILVLIYGSENLGQLVFSDGYDTKESEDLYISDYHKVSETDPGNWFVYNGQMYQYDNLDRVRENTGFSCANMVKDKEYKITSISVDAMLLDSNAWAGLRWGFHNSNFYRFTITTKNGDRMSLRKTGTVLANPKNIDKMGFDMEMFKWFNIRINFHQDTGIIQIYIDDKLLCEVEDEPLLNAPILTQGMVGLVGAEGWVKYDNLEIRGEEVEYATDDWVRQDTNLEPKEYLDDFNDETAGKNPSHWLELTTTDLWKVRADGANKVYGSTGCTETESKTWLHVFETNVDYTARMRMTAQGEYARFGLTARVTADESYIKAGYDCYMRKWFIQVRYAEDFEPEIFYSDADFILNTNAWYNVRLKVVDQDLQLYVDGKLLVTANAGKKVSVGRVGAFNERCNIDIDDVNLQQLSGQGRVQDGVMEQYTKQAGASTGTLFQVLQLSDTEFLMYEGANRYISYNEGMTWERADSKLIGDFKSNATCVLHDGKVLNIVGWENVYVYDTQTRKSEHVGTIEWPLHADYHQPDEHINEVQLEDGTWRIFVTITEHNFANFVDPYPTRTTSSQVFYSDDGGRTWTQSETFTADLMNLKYFGESQVIKITKDVVDLTGKVLPAGTMIHYATHNDHHNMRYTLSFDNGKTWVGDYAMPHLTTSGMNSFTIEEDRFNPGTYYMAYPYNIPSRTGSGFPRQRVVLLRSTDGYNWDFVCDVDRWGDVADTDTGFTMQNVNMNLMIMEDYIFVGYSRSDIHAETTHRIQLGRLYRFEKDKLEVQEWPKEYIIPDKAIVTVEGIYQDIPYYAGRAEYKETDVLKYPIEGYLKLYYYDGTVGYVSMDEVKIANLSTVKLGEQEIIADYNYFRARYTVNVVPSTESYNSPFFVRNEEAVTSLKMGAGVKMYTEYSKSMREQLLTVTGQGAYIVVDGMRYDAVDGVVKVVLPYSKSAIPVIIGNASDEDLEYALNVSENVGNYENTGGVPYVEDNPVNPGDPDDPDDPIDPDDPGKDPENDPGKDPEPKPEPDMTLWIIIGVAAAVLVAGAVVAVILVKKRRKKAQNQSEDQETQA